MTSRSLSSSVLLSSIVVGCVVGCLVVGCATTDLAPVTSVNAETSSAAIRAAEEVGAMHNPDAALHLQLAKEQFEAARKMTDPNDRDHAARMLMRSQADAELALALARTETDKTEAAGADARVKTLKDSATQ